MQTFPTAGSTAVVLGDHRHIYCHADEITGVSKNDMDGTEKGRCTGWADFVYKGGGGGLRVQGTPAPCSPAFIFFGGGF